MSQQRYLDGSVEPVWLDDQPTDAPRGKQGDTPGEVLAKAKLNLVLAQAAYDEAAAEFALLYGKGTYEEAGAKVTVSYSSSLNKARAARLYGDLDIFGEPVPVADKLKRVLNGEQYAALLDTKAEPTVIVKLSS